MMETFSRSWQLTKLSFGVLRADKEMLLFPLIGGIFSLLYVIAILYPTVISGVLSGEESQAFSALDYILSFITYFGLAFIATFFNVCTVYTTKVRFEGGDATFKESIAFGFSKLSLIFTWALVSATVGIILRAIDHLASRVGGVGETVINVLQSLLGMAWSIVTLFVIPVMVYRGLGPKDAIKASTEALKKTWGESLVRHYGLGLVQFLCMLAGTFVFGGLISATGGGTLSIVIGVVGIAYFVGVVLMFSVLNAVFNTALYVYAETGSTPGGFDRSVVESAFLRKTFD